MVDLITIRTHAPGCLYTTSSSARCTCHWAKVIAKEEARRPLPPDVLADALHDRIHPTSGRMLRTQPIIGTREQREMESMRRELEALRALEARLRAAPARMPYPLRDDVLALLEAVDEARK
jgi:hypothetical protein